TVAGVVGAAWLLQCLIIVIKQFVEDGELKIDGKKAWIAVFVVAIIFLYFLPIGALPRKYWFDRYLILLMPLLMMVVSISTVSIKRNTGVGAICISLALLSVYGAFTITWTHDYLAWNRVRWQALNNLMQDVNILPSQIYGGREYNGWHFGNKV